MKKTIQVHDLRANSSDIPKMEDMELYDEIEGFEWDEGSGIIGTLKSYRSKYQCLFQKEDGEMLVGRYYASTFYNKTVIGHFLVGDGLTGYRDLDVTIGWAKLEENLFE